MSKSMLKPGLLAGVAGGIVSMALAVLLVLALLIPGQVALTLYCLSTPIGLLLDLGIGLLAAWLAQSRSLEKLTANRAALAGLVAGVVATLIGTAALPITQSLPGRLGLQDRMIEVQLMPARMMGVPEDQIEVTRAQIIAMQEGRAASGSMLAGIVGGLVCGTIVGAALSTGGAALGTLIFKPAWRKLVCGNCQAAFELGGNAFIEATSEGSPDLVDYCTWEDFLPDVARQHREVIVQVLKTKDQGRHWQCAVCKTAQLYL